MATGGAKSDIDKETSSSDEGDPGLTQDDEWMYDEDWFESMELEESDCHQQSDQSPSTSSKFQGKTTETTLNTSATSESSEPTLPPLQRTPRIESTPISLYMVKEILVGEHKVEEEKAKAAARQKGCDIELCLQWIETNRSRVVLMKEKSKEFDFFCGIISKQEMKEWIVHQLTSRYSVIHEIAKAAAQIESFGSFRECKTFASSGVSAADVMELKEAYDDEKGESSFSANGMATLLEEVKRLRRTPVKDWPFESLGISGKLKATLSTVKYVLGFETLFRWLLRNQYAEEKLLALGKAKTVDCNRGMKTRTGYAKAFYEEFGKFLNEYVTLREMAVQILKDFMTSPEAKAVAHVCHDTVTKLDLDRSLHWTNGDDVGIIQKFLVLYTNDESQQIFQTKVRLMTNMMNKVDDILGIPKFKVASVIADSSMIRTSSTDFKQCLKWIRKRKKEAHKDMVLIHTLETLDAGTPEWMAFLSTSRRSLIQEYCYDAARSVLRMENRGTNMVQRFFLYYLNKYGKDSELEKTLIPRLADQISILLRDLSTEKRVVFYKANSRTSLCMAAMGATLSTNVSECMEWITRNSEDQEMIDLFHRAYAQERAGLSLLRPIDILTDYDLICTDIREIDLMQNHGFISREKFISRNVGDRIGFGGCGVSFPPYSLKCDGSVKVTVESQGVTDKSGDGIKISPKLGCDLTSVGLVPGTEVDVEILAYCFAQPPVEIAVMSQDENSDNWFIEKRLMLGRDRKVKFKTSHFSYKYLKVVKNTGLAWVMEQFGMGDYLKFPIEPYLFYNEFGVFRAYACLDDKVFNEELEQKHEKRGFVSAFIKPEVLIAKLSDEILVKLQCVDPPPVNFGDPSEFKFTSDELIDKNCKEFDFRLKNIKMGLTEVHLTLSKLPPEGAEGPTSRIAVIKWPLNTDAEARGSGQLGREEIQDDGQHGRDSRTRAALIEQSETVNVTNSIVNVSAVSTK